MKAALWLALAGFGLILLLGNEPSPQEVAGYAPPASPTIIRLSSDADLSHWIGPAQEQLGDEFRLAQTAQGDVQVDVADDIGDAEGMNYGIGPLRFGQITLWSGTPRSRAGNVLIHELIHESGFVKHTAAGVDIMGPYVSERPMSPEPQYRLMLHRRFGGARAP